MSQFIESICCIDGELQLLDLHQARVNRTFFTNYGLLAKPIRLSRVIRQIPTKGKHKCRVVYDKDNASFSFEPYQTPNIGSLKLVDGNTIDYRYKYADRSQLDALFEHRKEGDDIIIVKDGVVTDSYFANLAFFDGEAWWTPEEPLLAGVQRQNLLDIGHLQIKKITAEDLVGFEKVSLINAMNKLGEIIIEIPSILS